MQRNSLKIIGVVSLFLISFQVSFARDLWYGTLIGLSGDTATIELRGLENKSYFSCSVQTQQCAQLSGAPISDASSIVSSSPESFVSFPSTSTHQNTSSTKRFGFFVTLSASKKSRVMGLIDTKTGKRYTVTDAINFWNLLDLQPRVSRFAPDDSTLTYLDDRSGFASLYLVDLSSISSASFHGTQITSGVTAGDFTYVDPKTILYIANTPTDPYNWILYSYDLTTATKKVLAQNLVYDDLIHLVGNKIVVTELTPLGTMPVVLTDDSGSGAVKNFQFPIKAPSSADSIKYTYQNINGINAVAMTDPNSPAKSHPLIVWLHGGPYRQGSFNRHPYISYGVYDWTLEQAVYAGAYVLKIDYAGSYGAGRTFTERIKGGVGKTDMTDVMNTINTFIAHNAVNGVYTYGNSYGGYLALRTAVGYPSAIDGALSVNGVTDWTSLLKYYKNSIFNTFFKGLPSKSNAGLYAKASILSRLKTLKNPVYIIQGSVDATIPKSQAALLKSVLDAANKTSTLSMIPGENHVFLKDSSINTICVTLFKMAGLDVSHNCNLQD